MRQPAEPRSVAGKKLGNVVGARKIVTVKLVSLTLCVAILLSILVQLPSNHRMSGLGLDSELLERFFMPFVTTDVIVNVDRTVADGISQLAVGATHAQFSLDPWGDPEAVAQGKELLRQVAVYQNQHIMGFGALNPEPFPGVYDWARLDERVQLMRESGAIPIITLCCAPDWMKGGQPGEIDWSKLEVAPLPEHYDDFAELAHQVALRYPDVKHYVVWNEFKGFWKPEINNWDYLGYTTLYNKVYDVLKSIDPTIQVGGPYLVIEGTGSEKGGWWSEKPIRERNRQVIEYWLKHKHGADFLAVDRKMRDQYDTNQYTEAEYLALTPFFGDVTRQLQETTDLPIWWVESSFEQNGQNHQFEAVGLASMLYHQLKAGATVSMRWAPQAQPGDGHGQNFFTDTMVAGGGQPLPPYYVYKAFHDHFGPNTQLYRASSSSPDVEVLASCTKVLLINKRPNSITANVNGKYVTMNGYEVRVMEVSDPCLYYLPIIFAEVGS